jgi:nucleoside-diphosphate-sugar epimerase
VDEASPTEPLDFRGRRLLEGEALVAASGLPATVVRFAGIYGPGRRRLLERVARGEAEIDPGRPRYTNRIHRDDCAGLLAHLLETGEHRGPSAPPLLIGVDDEPAAERTVLCWLAEQLAAPEPRERAAPAERAAMANRRCRNARLRASGYALRYPTFRQGYAAMLRESG